MGKNFSVSVILPAFIFFACNVSIGAEASEPSAISLSINIKDAVNFTLENNTVIKKSNAAYDEERAKSSGIWGSLLPEVSFEYDWTRRKGSVQSEMVLFDGMPYNSYSAGLVFTQPLLRGGRLWSAPTAQSAVTEGAKLETEITVRRELYGMALDYYSLLLYQEQTSTLKRQFETQKKLIAQARQRFRMGAERELTVLQYETKSALLKPLIIQAENNAQSAAVQLLNRLGKSDVSSIRVRGSLESITSYRAIDPGNVDISAKPEIRKVFEDVRAIEASKAVVMSEHWPSVSLKGGVAQNAYTQNELFSSDSREWYYGIHIEVPLFSGLSSFSKRRELAAQVAGVRYQEKQTRDNAAIALIQSEKSLRTARELVDAKKIAFDLARRSYHKASQMFGYGTLDYQKFFDIEEDLIEAELSYSRSLYDLLTSAMDFHVATGQDLRGFLAALAVDATQ